MSFLLRSLCTWSYWRYAVFSPGAGVRILAAIGVIWLFIELLEFFSIYTKDKYSSWAFILVIATAVVYTVLTRRPVKRVRYKIPKKDFSFEVRIDDLLQMDGEVIISSNTTFDTDISNGLISQNSLQGQFLLQMFQGNLADLDRQISESLSGERSRSDDSKPGKKEVYKVGTVAKVKAHGRNYYFLAMAELNEFGTAGSTVRMIDDALEALWKHMANKGELGDIVIPVLGTGRGRINMSRKKMIERIAQSFADASAERIFARKLTIVVHPKDAEEHSINLFEIKDYLSNSLQV